MPSRIGRGGIPSEYGSRIVDDVCHSCIGAWRIKIRKIAVRTSNKGMKFIIRGLNPITSSDLSHIVGAQYPSNRGGWIRNRRKVACSIPNESVRPKRIDASIVGSRDLAGPIDAYSAG